MNLIEEAFYYLVRIFKKKTLQSKREKEWYSQCQRYKCIFIHIPKTAGVSISASLLGNGIANTPSLYYKILFGKENFNNYFKFSFVRNPFTRLISVYEFLQSGGGGPLDEKIVSTIQPYKSFKDFVLQYLNQSTIKVHRYFRPQSYFVCDSNHNLMINFLGRFEELEKDYEFIRTKVGTGEPLKKLNVTKSKKLSLEECYCNRKIIEKVTLLYAKDFELFGYSKEISARFPG
jgi:hypothetical protein